jgi:flavin-dependent dehydrogenase
VVVVGGRIAGSLTALGLAAHGVSVRLLESRDFPSDTLSTHFFRGDGLVRALDDVGVLDEVLSTGAPPLTCEYSSVDGGPLEQGPPQEPGRIGYCLSVRRIALDAILARRCVAAGVEVRTRTKVVELVRQDGAVAGVVDSQGETHGARVIVAADGRRSTVVRLVGAAVAERHPPARIMHYRYATGWRSPGEVGPEFLLDGGDLCYALPSDGGVTCLAVSVPLSDRASAGMDPAHKLEQTLRTNPQLRPRRDRLTWTSRMFTGRPRDSAWREGAGPGWALVGDAGTAQDPWAGLGMDTAARQAEAFVDAFTGIPEDWCGRYDHLRREHTYEGYRETTQLARDLRQVEE